MFISDIHERHLYSTDFNYLERDFSSEIILLNLNKRNSLFRKNADILICDFRVIYILY